MPREGNTLVSPLFPLMLRGFSTCMPRMAGLRIGQGRVGMVRCLSLAPLQRGMASFWLHLETKQRGVPPKNATHSALTSGLLGTQPSSVFHCSSFGTDMRSDVDLRDRALLYMRRRREGVSPTS